MFWLIEFQKLNIPVVDKNKLLACKKVVNQKNQDFIIH